MASCKEIITLQFGDFANLVGAHYFNIQDAGFSFNPTFIPEIDNDILFREDRTSYTPRLVLVGSKKSIQSKIRDEANLERLKQDLGFDIEIPQLQDVEQSNIMDIDNQDDTRWLEILNLDYHEKSINSIETTESEQVSDVASFQNGKNIWKRENFLEDFTDDIRYQMEACDNAQGFQILIEAKSQFSGIGAGCLEYLNDEYTKKSKISLLLYDKGRSNEDLLKNFCAELFTGSQIIAAASEHSDLVIPLSTFESHLNSKERTFPDIEFINNYRHSSSILAAGLDLFTLPFRRRERVTLNYATSCLHFLGRNVLTSAISLPFERHGSLYDSLKLDRFVTLTPDITTPYFENIDLQFISSKGISDDFLIRPEDLKLIEKKAPELKITTANKLMEYYFFDSAKARTCAHSVKDKLRIPKNFPDYFTHYKTLPVDPRVLEEMKKIAVQAGCKPEELTTQKIKSLAGIGSIANSCDVVSFLATFDLKFNRSKFRIMSNYEHYITKSDLEQAAESLTNIITNYSSFSYL